MSELTRMTSCNEQDGGYTWGKLVEIHRIDNIQIVEYFPALIFSRVDGTDKEDQSKFLDEVSFHPYIDEGDTSQSFNTLKQALVGAIAYEADGDNSRAAKYFFRMIGIDK